MEIGSRDKKRILIFSIIPVLVAIPFFTDDFIIRLLTAATLVIYTAFIIFLRDSSRIDESFLDTASAEEDLVDEVKSKTPHSGNFEEDGFKIISPNKNIEVVRSNDAASSQGISSSKSYFKPPDLKSTFEKIATEKIPKNISHDQHFGFALEKILDHIDSKEGNYTKNSDDMFNYKSDFEEEEEEEEDDYDFYGDDEYEDEY